MPTFKMLILFIGYFLDNLQVCGLQKTCCMPNAVKNLQTSSEEKRKDVANPLHHHLKDIFQVKKLKFKGKIRE